MTLLINLDNMITYKNKEQIAELQYQYEQGTLAPTTKEKLVINPKIAYEVVDQDILSSIPFKDIEKEKNKFGSLSRFSTYTPVKNLIWDYLYFVDSSIFRPAAKAFEESRERFKHTKIPPTYTKHLPGTTAYKKFWEEEGRRIIQGYEPIVDGKPCGIRISGEYYFYLNYGWMVKLVLDKETGEPIGDESGFPDFLAMDYYYFRELEARETPSVYKLPYSYKQAIAVAKGRRLGFSYKAASGAVWVTAFRNNAKVAIASAEGIDAVRCFDKAMDIVDHLTKYTPFGREDIGSTKTNGGWKYIPKSQNQSSGQFTFGMVNTRTGERVGRLSEIFTISLFNKPDAASGSGLARLYFEEAGKIDDLSNAWTFSKETLRVGSVYRDGIAIIFGTGGEMVSASGKKGSSKDFSMLFNNPKGNGLGEFENIYEYKATGNSCGFFFPSMWFKPSSNIVIDGKKYFALDKNGNAFFWVSEIIMNMDRELVKPPMGTKSKFEKEITQIPKTPSEAFLTTTGSRFQIEDLISRQTEILSTRSGFEGLRMPGELVDINGIISFIPKPDYQPITSLAMDTSHTEGCLLLYEHPIKDKGKILDDAYIISVDPIGINTDSGKSLIAIIVYKTNKYIHLMGEEKIVATYYGRKKTNPQEYMHNLLLKLSKFYNARITFENDRDGGILQYFLKIGELRRLMETPTLVMNKYIPGSKSTLREWGHSMSSARHKEIGETLIYEWLDIRSGKKNYFDTETGEKIIQEGLRNLDRLQDQLLIEQLINYDRQGNYDAVSALMGIMFQLKEWYDPTELDATTSELSKELVNWYEKKFKR